MFSLCRSTPRSYLYPYISEWPAPSRTAETLIIRREGNDALFLNNLRFQDSAALKLRFSLDGHKELPAVKAVLGQEGIVEGVDYRGVPVIAAVDSVPNTPWFLVARMDISEVYAPVRERMWTMLGLVGILLLGAGVSFWLAWRQRRLQYYREKYEMEAALRESESRFRQISESLPQLVWTCRLDGPCDYLSPQWVGFTGIPEAQQLGFGWLDQIHPDDRSALLTAWNKAVETGKPFRAEFRIRHHSGEYHWFDTRASALRDESGRIVKWFGLNMNITERKRMEETLKVSELRYRRLFETAKDGILLIDYQTEAVTDANPYMTETLGYSHDELVGKRLWELGLPKDVNASKAAFAKLKKEFYIRYETLPLQRKDGRQIEVEFVSNVYQVDDGKVIQCNIRDITAHRRAQEELRYLGTHDALTGIYNRAYFEEELKRLEHGQSLSSECGRR